MQYWLVDDPTPSAFFIYLPRLHYITYSDQFNDNVQHCIIVITTLLPRPSQVVFLNLANSRLLLYLYSYLVYFVFSCPTQAFGKIQNALIFVFVLFVFHISMSIPELSPVCFCIWQNPDGRLCWVTSWENPLTGQTHKSS